MPDDPLISASARELRRLIDDGEILCSEVAEAAIAHIEATNPALNAMVHFDANFVREQAQVADRRFTAGERGSWLGLPFTVKDNLWIAGQPASNGSALFRDFVAPTDALAVRRLRDAGAVVLGSTNCSEFACKGVTHNPLHGTTRNPWDLARTPGGSSGGAVAALAAGIGCIALATDAGGSTRRPASHTGLVGLKPSAGAIPHAAGFAEPVYGNSVVGLLARTVEDVRDTLALLAQPDPADPQCAALPFFDAAAAQPMAWPLARIAYSPRLGLGFPVDTSIAAAVREMAQALSAAGHHVEEVDPPWPTGTSEEALMPLQHAGLAALYGARWRNAPWDADPDIANQIEVGLALRGSSVAAALELRKQLYASLQRLFTDFDVLLTPTTPVTAWPLDQAGPTHIEGRAVSPRGHAVFTPIFNHCFVPACSVPCGMDAQGLPIGVQIVGALHADARVLAIASWVESLTPQDFSRIRRP